MFYLAIIYLHILLVKCYFETKWIWKSEICCNVSFYWHPLKRERTTSNSVLHMFTTTYSIFAFDSNAPRLDKYYCYYSSVKEVEHRLFVMVYSICWCLCAGHCDMCLIPIILYNLLKENIPPKTYIRMWALKKLLPLYKLTLLIHIFHVNDEVEIVQGTSLK